MAAKRVLLVEDDSEILEVTALLLGHAGYEVVVAPDLTSGIAIALGQPGVNVVMADMYLGDGQTGTSLIQTIRDSGLRIPIVLTSANDEASAPAREMNVVFLPKPYGLRALLSAMARASAGKPEMQQPAPN